MRYPLSCPFDFALPSTAILLATFSLSACLPGERNQPAIVDEPPARIVSPADLDSQALSRIARSAEDSGGRLIDPATIYRRLAERQPGDPQPRLDLGRYLLRQNDLPGSEAAFRDALKVAPGNADAETGLGQILLARGKWDEAVGVFDALSAREPGDMRGLNGAGLAFDGLRRHADAQERYRAALKIAPGDMTIRNNLGLSLALSGAFPESIALLRTLVAEPEATQRHRDTLARALSLQSRPPSAAVSRNR
jgi:Flp pilus assembly protein TadD